jgi:hypothetical protein
MQRHIKEYTQLLTNVYVTCKGNTEVLKVFTDISINDPLTALKTHGRILTKAIKH